MVTSVRVVRLLAVRIWRRLAVWLLAVGLLTVGVRRWLAIRWLTIRLLTVGLLAIGLLSVRLLSIGIRRLLLGSLSELYKTYGLSIILNALKS